VSAPVSPGHRRILALCAWSGIAFLAVYLIGFVGFAHFVPPPPPSLTADQIAALYDGNRFGIRFGMIVALIGSTLLFPFFTLISLRMARAERGTPILAAVQFAGAILLIVFFGLCSMLWIAASFRPELDPSTVRALHDLSWLVFVMVFPAFTLQMICIAVAGFLDDSPRPIWPRWVSYVNVWMGIAGMGGGLAVFFTTGPFAWNGFVGFYIPIVAFVLWLGVMTAVLRRGVRDDAEADAGVEPARSAGLAAPVAGG
jgi:hypothetical protein